MRPSFGMIDAQSLLYIAAVLFAVTANSFQSGPILKASLLSDVSFYSFNQRVDARSHFELSFQVAGRAIQLELSPNNDLLSPDSLLELHNGDGTLVDRRSIQREDFKVFKGYAFRSNGVESVRQGWARIFLHSSSPLVFEGSFSLDGAVHQIQLLSSYMASKSTIDFEILGRPDDMVSWTDFDPTPRLDKRGLADDPIVCSVEPEDRSAELAPLLKRQIGSGDTGRSYTTQQTLATTIGQTSGCPKQRLVALIGVAADCNFVARFNSSDAARANIISQFNQASILFENAFNISLGLSTIVLSETTCPQDSSSSPWNTVCSSSVSINDRLNLFSRWRGQRNDSLAAWSLLSTCNSGAEVGVAWLGTVCSRNFTSQGATAVSGANVVTSTTNTWKTLAHELAHNFGAVHDCTTSSCGTGTSCCPLSQSSCDAGGQYLMNPSASAGVTAFSPCTIGQVCSNFQSKKINTFCMTTNQQVKLDSSPTCGNGIVEEGEDCEGSSPCCNPATCKFRPNAVCDDRNSACCKGCQFAPSSSICRPSIGTCDPEEFCAGNSAFCPRDLFAPDGQSCGSGLACASGQCTSRNLQCQQSMNGSTTACDQNQCQLTCIIGGQCYIANSYFITGTPCGGGGTCRTGQCDQGDVGKQIKSWLDSNKTWVIVGAAVIGGLLFISFVTCIFRRCARGITKTQPLSPVATPMHYYSQQPPPPCYAPPQPGYNPYGIPDPTIQQWPPRAPPIDRRLYL